VEVITVAVTNKAVHAQAVRLPAASLVRELLDHLGPTVVAALAGVRDRTQPYRWSIEDGPTPRDASLSRLQVAYRAWSTIVESDGVNVARAWFIGANPRFDERAPYLVIRDGLFSDVLAAAEEFVDRSPHTAESSPAPRWTAVPTGPRRRSRRTTR
jgi:hypothetical protein